jgi:hypothetical protein
MVPKDPDLDESNLHQHSTMAAASSLNQIKQHE